MVREGDAVRLLRALQNGRRLWARTSGRSMWPVLRDGDGIRILRCERGDLRRGDIAVFTRHDGRLVAHFVVTEAPLRTCSSMGALDPPGAELLGRVVEVRRGRVRLPLPSTARHLLRWAPVAARAARRLPFAIALVRALRGW